MRHIKSEDVNVIFYRLNLNVKIYINNFKRHPIYGDTELMIDWKEMYGSLEPGIYRLNKEFYDRYIYGAAFKHILSVQFSISGD